MAQSFAWAWASASRSAWEECPPLLWRCGRRGRCRSGLRPTRKHILQPRQSGRHIRKPPLKVHIISSLAFNLPLKVCHINRLALKLPLKVGYLGDLSFKRAQPARNIVGGSGGYGRARGPRRGGGRGCGRCGGSGRLPGLKRRGGRGRMRSLYHDRRRGAWRRRCARRACGHGRCGC